MLGITKFKIITWNQTISKYYYYCWLEVITCAHIKDIFLLVAMTIIVLKYLGSVTEYTQDLFLRIVWSFSQNS